MKVSRRFVKFAAIFAIVLVGAGFGVVRVAHDIDRYDMRYEQCMAAKDAALHPRSIYFPDDVYDQAMRECEHTAGLPDTHTEHPHPWNETP